MIRCTLSSALTEEEKKAVSCYGRDSTFFHAVAQYRQSELSELPKFQEFVFGARSLIDQIDSAILKASLDADATLYSGHGQGTQILGALHHCEPTSYIGATYRYEGYISTSACRQIALDSFMIKRASARSRPVLMTINVQKKFHALDMQTAGHFGEGEFLIGRNKEFRITNAVEAAYDDVQFIELTMEP